MFLKEEAANFTSNSGTGPRETDRKAPRLRLRGMWCQRGPRGHVALGGGLEG